MRKITNFTMEKVDMKRELSDRLWDEGDMYTYIKNYATAKQMNQTIKALPYSHEQHRGQYRRGQDEIPYIYHPLMVACHALALGLDDDNIVATALLHDVCEDCGVKVDELPVNEEIQKAVALLTKDKSISAEKYYERITQNEIATMVKLLDRCNNVSDMSAGFTKDKLCEYMIETEKWYYPLMKRVKEKFPKYSNQIFLIKYHISSVLESIKHQL